jgi:excisionase family DNA binding protein
MGRRARPSGLSLGAESNVMTVQDLAEYLHCHYITVYRLCQRREIPGFKIGSDWRFLKSALDEWIAKGEVRPSGRAPAKTGDGRRRRKPMSKTARS